LGEWLLEQERRRTRIAKFCANKVKQQNLDRLHFHLNKEHNLLFCFQPKVGSTTWLNHFISLEKRDDQQKLASLERFEKVKYLSPTDLDLVSLAKASISISMVRHPFERLVSAYQNKIADNERELWAEYRALISAQIGDTSFQSFVKWLVSNMNQVILEVHLNMSQEKNCPLWCEDFRLNIITVPYEPSLGSPPNKVQLLLNTIQSDC